MNKVFLITESVVNDLVPTINESVNSKGEQVKEYILEGCFAKFDVENNNNRIYEAKEYLPHLKALNEKIKESRLIGELDHPPSFDIKLENASHKIIELRYVQESKEVRGKIVLLDTPKGRIAKSLIDSKFPLSISSRAAGTVNEDKTVSIKKIFTYDLVADPGFTEAQLGSVNESLGFSKNSHVQIFDIGMTEDIIPTNESQINNSTTNKSMENYVTKDELQKYSQHIVEENKKLTSTVQQLKKYTNYLAEKLDDNISYSNYLAENVDKTINYSNYIAEKLNSTINYTDYLAETVDKSISYSEYVAEKVSENIKYSEYIAEQLDLSIQHGDYLAENIDKSISYTEYVAEKLQSSIEYSEYIAENVGNTTSGTEKINESVSLINESKSHSLNVESLDESINRILNIAKEEQGNKESLLTEYPFLRYVNESKVNEFKGLSEKNKEKIRLSLIQNPSTNSEVIQNVWESALANPVEATDTKWLTEAPAKYRALYETLSVPERERLHKDSKIYRLNTPYQIENFWNTRFGDTVVDQKLTESIAFEPLNESSANLGYSNDFVKQTLRQLESR